MNYSVSLPAVVGISLVKSCKFSMDLLVGTGPIATKFEE
jgi:hypothetical protein